jgi:hypothetical protein
MFAWRYWHISFAIVALTFSNLVGSATAQELDSKSYGTREINRFRNQAVNDYSVDKLVQTDLRNARARGVSVGTGSPPSRSYGDLGIGSFSGSKPFSNVTATPTVSPYLNLFREDMGGNDDLNYQTLVRPQLEQQRTNALLQRQNQELSRRVQTISAQRDFAPTGAQNQYPTGHPTVFNYHGRYYPAMRHR